MFSYKNNCFTNLSGDIFSSTLEELDLETGETLYDPRALATKAFRHDTFTPLNSSMHKYIGPHARLLD